MNQFKVIKYILLFTFIVLGIMVNANLNIKYTTDAIPIESSKKESECQECKKCDNNRKPNNVNRNRQKNTIRNNPPVRQIPSSNINHDIDNDQYSRFYWANNN